MNLKFALQALQIYQSGISLSTEKYRRFY